MPPASDLTTAGTFTCTGVNWTLDGSNCYKTIPGSNANGQASCSNEDPNATLMLAPAKTTANHVSSLFPGESIWIDLRFQNGSEWIWGDGSTGSSTWGSTPILPQLCIGVWDTTGLMFDYYCYNTQGLICQKERNNTGSCELGWTRYGTQCFKRLRHHLNDGVTFVMQGHSAVMKHPTS
ncbi:unnamed protein product [Mytilus edulis]|uniref:C-type lectin domain-containing protein n=1 Tax=Mytilus edulis TaxID=6550 RepID=A0A8S3UMT7_MYTED|nr:unnamed protein product [Mytilus edulis]